MSEHEAVYGQFMLKPGEALLRSYFSSEERFIEFIRYKRGLALEAEHGHLLPCPFKKPWRR